MLVSRKIKSYVLIRYCTGTTSKAFPCNIVLGSWDQILYDYLYHICVTKQIKPSLLPLSYICSLSKESHPWSLSSVPLASHPLTEWHSRKQICMHSTRDSLEEIFAKEGFLLSYLAETWKPEPIHVILDGCIFCRSARRMAAHQWVFPVLSLVHPGNIIS